MELQPTSTEFLVHPNQKLQMCGLRFTKAVKNRRVFVFLHGAGLDFRSPFYSSLAMFLSEVSDVVLVGLRASGFLNYNVGFRKPLGWAFHRTEETIEDYQAWLEWLPALGYETFILGGHSWGALLALIGAPESLRSTPAVLVSPLPSTYDIIQVNFGSDAERSPSFSKDLISMADQSIITTINNAPFSFLSAATIKDLMSSQWTLPSILDCWQGPFLTTIGELEHASLLKALTESTASRSGCTFVRIRKQGHFYTTGANTVATEIKNWLARI